LFDIEKDQIPYPDSMFEFVICSGVLHFFSDLEKIFEQVSKVLISNGFFVFTIIENRINDNPINSLSANGVSVYHHSREYINSLEKANSFSPFQEQTFTTIKDLETKSTLDFTLNILRKQS
jgi:predicted TPR repeat methyltransferase